MTLNYLLNRRCTGLLLIKTLAHCQITVQYCSLRAKNIITFIIVIVFPEIFRIILFSKGCRIRKIIIENYALLINFRKVENILNICLFEIFLYGKFFVQKFHKVWYMNVCILYMSRLDMVSYLASD